MYKLISVILTAFPLAACSHSEPDTQSNTSTGQVTTSVFEGAAPCNIALTPKDQTEINSSIARHQQAVIHNKRPLLNLEKLGWAFISKARRAFDPGLYMLAKQAALCLEQRQPNSLEALLLRGHVLHNLHKFKEAESLARKLINERGAWFDHGLLGDVLMEQGKLDEAEQAYQEMMDQRPGPQAYSRAGYLRWLKGDLAGAVNIMQFTLQANSTRDTEAAAWAHVRYGLYLLQAGDFLNAGASFIRALELQPHYPPALFAQGRLNLAEHDYQHAIQSLAKAVQQTPLPEYQWLLIEALRADGQYQRATEIEVELMKNGATEDRRTLALYLATTHQHIGKALHLAQQELKHRKDIFTMDAIAWSLHATNRIPEAQTYSKRAIAEGTQDARLFYHAGVIARAAGDNEEAMQWFNKAIAIQQMLFPSERTALHKYLRVVPQSTALASNEN